MSSRSRDVIIIGAGPYGLAAAAHLRGGGVDAHVFGVPMTFWKNNMPKGMLLRSAWGASHIGHPRSQLSLDTYERFRGAPLARPIPIADFVAYADWFRERAVPDVDERRVDRVEPLERGFQVVLEDGETMRCARVAVAAGLGLFAWRPPEFADVGPDLVSHTGDQADLGRFAGRRVAVIGGGQSAVESSVLLHEAGAQVENIQRSEQVRWVGRAPREGLAGRIFFDRTDVGPALLSHLIARPMLWKRLSAFRRLRVTKAALAPGVALWLRSRMTELPMTFGRQVIAARRANGHVELTLDDYTTREVDHVLLGTGYRVDVTRYPFLPAAVASRVKRIGGEPVLDNGFQSSVPGLYFLGAPGVHSFGGLVRFVSGTEFTTRALLRSVTGRVHKADRVPDLAFEQPTVEGRTP